MATTIIVIEDHTMPSADELHIVALGPKKPDGSRDQHLLKVKVSSQGIKGDGVTEILTEVDRTEGETGLAGGPRTVTRLDPNRPKRDA